MIARDAPFVETLRAVISLAGRLEPGSIAGATIVDRAERSLEMAVFGSVDRAFSDAIAGVPLGPPHVGTCAQALYRGEVVTSEDLATDTRFAKEWVQLCEDHGIRSCRSQPIRTANGNPLGTVCRPYPPTRFSRKNSIPPASGESLPNPMFRAAGCVSKSKPRGVPVLRKGRVILFDDLAIAALRAARPQAGSRYPARSTRGSHESMSRELELMGPHGASVVFSTFSIAARR
jgi:GAF domain-containing protein